MWAWSLAGSWRAETLPLTSLHVAANIHAFFLASWSLGFGMALLRAAKSPSYLVGVVRGRRESRLCLLMYLVCSAMEALRRHPRTR